MASWLGLILFIAPLLGAWCIPFAAADMLLMVVSAVGATFLHCPRCGRLFAVDGLIGKDPLFQDACLHCGIFMGTPKE